MTAEKFRHLALELPGAFEASHMGHADFRVGGKIFASLGYPDERYAMVKLTPEEQRSMMSNAPRVFSPCSGAWGRAGSTCVTLSAARVDVVRGALAAARRNVIAKKKRG